MTPARLDEHAKTSKARLTKGVDAPRGGTDLQRPVHLRGRPQGLPEEMRKTPRALDKPEERRGRSCQGLAAASALVLCKE